MGSLHDFLSSNQINIIPDFLGKIQRVKRSNNKSKDSWIYSTRFDSFEIVVFGDWSTQEHSRWTNKDENYLSDSERKQFSIAQKNARDQADADRRQMQALGADNAQKIFSKDDHQGKHPYLEKKQIAKASGVIHVKEYGEEFLAIPIKNSAGKLINAQKIYNDGTKLFLKGAIVKGGSFLIEGKDKSKAFIGEGYATCFTVMEHVSGDVYCAFNAGNVEYVYKNISAKYSEIYLITDDDRFAKNNTGKDLSTKLRAKYKNFLSIIPKFKNEKEGTDFNDLYIQEGHRAVRDCIRDQINLPKTTEIKSITTNAVHEMEDVGREGKPKSTIDNLRILLDGLGITVRYNIIKKIEEVLIPGESFTLDNQDNASYALLESWCNRLGMPTGSLAGFLTYLADKNIYNPVEAWITSRSWDGYNRLPELLSTVTAVGENSFEDDFAPARKVKLLKDTMITKWLISAVAAAFNPKGVSAHGVLVFQGPQYLGKTKWFLNLVPKEKDLVMQSAILRPDDKDSVKQVISNWLVELGELDATFKKSDIALLKGFLTKDEDILRMPYAKKNSRFARRTVFFGSVNPENYLNDPTGNRRFWTVSCEAIDHSHSIDMQQVWAQVYNLYKSGESYYLNNDEFMDLSEHNKGFQSLSFIEEKLKNGFNWAKTEEKDCQWLTATEILSQIAIERPSKIELNEASNVIRGLNGGQSKRINAKKLLKVPRKHPKSATE